MSRRRKKTEEKPRETEAIVQTPSIPSVNSDVEIEVQLFGLEEACRHFIFGYNARWLSSLRAFADSRGYKDSHSEQEWKSLFISWGAKLN
ncbi:MAG: hypothetical protein QXL01_02880 [Thermoplasmatales archaeon]